MSLAPLPGHVPSTPGARLWGDLAWKPAVVSRLVGQPELGLPEGVDSQGQAPTLDSIGRAIIFECLVAVFFQHQAVAENPGRLERPARHQTFG